MTEDLILKGAECSQVVSVPIEVSILGALSRISLGAWTKQERLGLAQSFVRKK